MSETLHIILLEGSAADADLVIDEIRQGGLRASFSHLPNGAELTQLLDQGGWDLVICNFQLSDISALDVLAEVRARQLDLPVIVLSDGIGEELAVTVMHAGAHDFITKANLARLVPAIERELEELAVHRQHKLAETALRESEQRFRQLTENIGEVFWLLDALSGEVIYLSPAFEEMWEQHAEQMLEDPNFILDTVHPDDFHRIQQCLESVGWQGFNAEYRIQLQDDQSRWVNTRSFPIRNEAGEIYRIAGLTIDVSERKQLAEEREMMSRALEQSADTVMITDARGSIVYVNAAFEAVTGYGKEEVLGKNPSLLKSGFQDAEFYAAVWKSLLNGIPFTDIFINRRKDGELYYEAKTITPVVGSNGELMHFVSTGKDITERLKTRERLHNLVHFDAVTGLANRVLLLERMEQALLQASSSAESLGVMCVGLDLSEMFGGLKQKRIAEHLLREVAKRLTVSIDSNITAARFGEDEFVILLKGVAGHDELEMHAKALIMAFAEPVSADGCELFFTPAVGISLFPVDGQEGDTLIQHAQLAMKHVRVQGQKSYEFYQGNMEAGIKHLSS